MNCKIVATPDFKRNLKKMGKRYKSMKDDFSALLDSLKENPMQGTDLGRGIRKIRLAITSKGKRPGHLKVISFSTSHKQRSGEKLSTSQPIGVHAQQYTDENVKSNSGHLYFKGTK